MTQFGTKVVRAGNTFSDQTGAITPPIYQTATYCLDEVGKDKGFDYSRSANPTRQALEQALAEIENAPYAVAFASGMSAVDSCMRLLKSGDHVVCSDDVYGGVIRLFDTILVDFGVTVTYVDTSDPKTVEAAIRKETRLIWLETPTNPLLKVSSVQEISQIAKAHGLLLGVDSTFATPALLRPFELGADIVLHSTTKYLSGHNQLIGGVVITKDEEIYDRLKHLQKSIGSVPGPFDCWLTMLGLRTLSLRMQKHCANAKAVAKFLEEQDSVERIFYPGLKNHHRHEAAAREMKDFGGMISFELKGGVPAGKFFINTLEFCCLAESLGAVETMVTHPASMTHASVPKENREARGLTDGLIRLSIGIEEPEDIIADLDQAFRKTEKQFGLKQTLKVANTK